MHFIFIVYSTRMYSDAYMVNAGPGWCERMCVVSYFSGTPHRVVSSHFRFILYIVHYMMMMTNGVAEVRVHKWSKSGRHPTKTHKHELAYTTRNVCFRRSLFYVRLSLDFPFIIFIWAQRTIVHNRNFGCT